MKIKHVYLILLFVALVSNCFGQRNGYCKAWIKLDDTKIIEKGYLYEATETNLILINTFNSEENKINNFDFINIPVKNIIKLKLRYYNKTFWESFSHTIDVLEPRFSNDNQVFSIQNIFQEMILVSAIGTIGALIGSNKNSIEIKCKIDGDLKDYYMHLNLFKSMSLVNNNHSFLNIKTPQ